MRRELVLIVGLAACGGEEPAFGDPARGKAVIARIECGACHSIPGVPGARGRIGPPLAGFGGRALIAGTLPNRPAILVAWLRDAPGLVPNTGMPAMRLSEAEARDAAAYLYTLR